MDYFVSDLHFNHKNIIQYDKRPFETVEEMNQTMIHLWNGRVRDEDNVYILGDFGYGLVGNIHSILYRLKGKKYLIRGNHDHVFLKKETFNRALFEWIEDIKKVSGGSDGCVLCHYPMVSWAGSHKGVIQLYGHTHTWLSPIPNSYNACAVVNNYMPCTIPEIIRNNEFWRKNNPQKTEWYSDNLNEDE